MSEQKQQSTQSTSNNIKTKPIGYAGNFRAESLERQHNKNDEWPRFLSHSSPVKGYRRFSHQDSTDSFGSAENQKVSFYMCYFYLELRYFINLSQFSNDNYCYYVTIKTARTLEINIRNSNYLLIIQLHKPTHTRTCTTQLNAPVFACLFSLSITSLLIPFKISHLPLCLLVKAYMLLHYILCFYFVLTYNKARHTIETETHT